MTAEEFRQQIGVSRETLDRLSRYVAVLERWQPRINLVGRSTLADVWRRHMLDSAQLHALLPPGATRLVDLGSGAGFPGMVLAIMGVPDVHLIESNHRKAAFLGEVSRETSAAVTVHPRRIEAVVPFAADVVTARALAPLDQLVRWARPFAGEETVMLFHKGQHVDNDLTQATSCRNMRVQSVPSVSDSTGTILRLTRAGRA